MRSLEELECVSDPEVDLFDEDDVERSKLPRPRRSKSVDFSTFVECVEVPRYFNWNIWPHVTWAWPDVDRKLIKDDL